MANEVEKVACPVCGKIVGVNVSSCPYCGAEFEADEEVEVTGKAGSPANAVTSEEAEEVACPVCGTLVGLDVIVCPKCGAEFEAEEIEEVIEVEEKATFEEEPEPAPAKPKRAESSKPKPKAKPAREEPSEGSPASILDLRVLGLALIMLGVVGTQIALFADWYWEWVPAIEDNMVLFVVIPVVILVVGLAVFMVMKKAASGGRDVSGMAPGAALALFMFGIIALIIVVLWDPVNAALKDSPATVAGGFAVALVLGIVFMVLGARRAASA
ncbi:MAG: hypothetical protein AB1793_08525 [Candidatus Thermoplasmatota archaeon]